MKFKLGDKVRVKGTLKLADTYKYRGRIGKIVTIALIDVDECVYKIDTAPDYYFFADSLEHYNGEHAVKERYKVGDRVIAVDNIGAHPDGAPGVIRNIFNDYPDNNNFDYGVRYDNDDCGTLWSNIICLDGERVPVVTPPVHGEQSVLESKMRYPTIVITARGRKTKAVLKCGDEVLRRATASCHPGDDFDQYVGASIALDRLFDRPVDIDAYEHAATPKPFEGKAVCVEKNPWVLVSARFTIGKVYEFSNGRVIGDNGSSFITASSIDNNWLVLGTKFIPFIEAAPTATRYEGTIICVDSDTKMFTPGKAYKVNDGCVYNDDGVLTSKVESDNIDGLNDEFEAIGVRFVEMVE